MAFTRNFVKIFLLIFLVVLALNIITSFFDSWNYFYGFALALMVIFVGMLFTRKKSKLIFNILSGVLVILVLFAICLPAYSYFHNRQITYSLDIGSEMDMNKPYLYPTDRVLGINSTQSSRDIIAQLIYFNVPSRNFDNANVTLRVLDNFPANGTMILSLKKDSKWNYLDKIIFNQTAQNSTNGNWTVLTATFSLEEAFIQNKTLTFLINTPHLGDSKTKKDYIAIDSINVTYFN